MKHLTLVFCIGLIALPIHAQTLSNEACEVLLAKAETDLNSDIYEDCRFNNPTQAWNTWAPFVASNNMKRAIFELCKRYPTHQYGP